MTQGRDPKVKKLRESHHRLARLCAMGLRNFEIEERTGYGYGRISTLRNDPAFKELVAAYINDVDEEWREATNDYYSTLAATRSLSAQLINDRLNSDDAPDLPLNQLVSIHADAADRTGFGKRSTVTNLNVDFAARLDQAIKQSGKAQPLRVVGELPSVAVDTCAEPRVTATLIENEPGKIRRRL